jgi:hypothetical protein
MIDLAIPEGYEDALVVIPDAARRMQTLCVGPRGVGKSMLLGLMAFFDFARDIPVVFNRPAWRRHKSLSRAYLAPHQGLLA